MFPLFPVADMTFTGVGTPFTFATAVGVALASVAGLFIAIALDNWWSRRQAKKTAAAVEELAPSRKAA
jgi:preprotein translocase subunit SecF